MILDLFAGPGGWDVAAQRLGIDPLGIEYDDAACQTRAAAGLRTKQADVSKLDPLDFAPCEGLIASPPCQAWSLAGKGGGERDKPQVWQAAAAASMGVDIRAKHAGYCEDARSMLVVEPVRWVHALRPNWVALEQVPPVLELWQRFAGYFREWGYSVWTGVLSSERFGVPQTRKRAILMARLAGPVSPPAPTHQGYAPGVPAEEQHTLEGVLLPWVSMADALGWTNDGAITTGNFTAGDYRLQRGVRYERPVSAPAPTVDGVAGRWEYDTRQTGAVPRGGGVASPDDHG